MVNYHLDFNFEKLVGDVVARVQRYLPNNNFDLGEVVKRSAVQLSNDDLRAVYERLLDAVSERALLSCLSREKRS